MEVFIVQQRDLPIMGEIDNSERAWENKKGFTTMARAYKYIQTLDSTVKKAFPDLRHDYHYVGKHFEWQIDIIELDGMAEGAIDNEK